MCVARVLSGCLTGLGQLFTRIQSWLYLIVEHSIFQQFILLSIFINTLSMAIEYHQQPDYLTKLVELSNLIFSFIFSLEMIMKLTAFGFITYVSDGFNVFDGLIVCFG